MIDGWTDRQMDRWVDDRWKDKQENGQVDRDSQSDGDVLA